MSVAHAKSILHTSIRSIAHFTVVLLLCVSCDHNSAEAGGSLPDSVQCLLFFIAPVPEGAGPPHLRDDQRDREQEATIRARRGEKVSGNVADLTLTLEYSSPDYEAATISVVAAFGGKRLVASLYQLQTNPPVRNQFLGGHGFTGLVYLTNPTKDGDYQYLCEVAP